MTHDNSTPPVRSTCLNCFRQIKKILLGESHTIIIDENDFQDQSPHKEMDQAYACYEKATKVTTRTT